MRQRWWVVTFAVGVALLVAAGIAPPSGSRPTRGVKQGGVLRVNISATDVQSVDPAIDYEFIGWQIENATCAKLVNYPDAVGPRGVVLRPEVAVAMPRVSRDGRTYTFQLRSIYRFNTGEQVTAETFVHVFERLLNPKMQSPASSFLHDLVGADRVLAGKAKRPAGVRANGRTLTIQLTKSAPDFLARLGMNFFCAVPLDYPIQPNLQKAPAAAGPYYIARRIPNRILELKRNPNYRGPRPHHLDGIEFFPGTDVNQSVLQIRRGQIDYEASTLPAPAHKQLAETYGVNKGRYFVHPALEVDYLALNTRRPLFRSANMRKAVNYALDRGALVRQIGYLGGEPTDQLLPPGIRGFRDVRIYPLRAPDLARAKRLAGEGGTATLYFPSGDPTALAQSQVIQANLGKIGIEVKTKSFAFGVLVTKIGQLDEPYDMILIGWIADYPDPFDFINVNLYRNLSTQNNQNLSRFNDPAFNRRMEQAAKLTGPARYAAYGKLDVDLMRQAAPWAPIANRTVREFVSERVGCFTYVRAFAAMDLAAACLKS